MSAAQTGKRGEQIRLKRLAAFVPAFRDPRTSFGKWHPVTGKGTLEEPLTSPWFELSEVADRFCKMLYDTGWILEGFDWTEWIHTPDAQKLLRHREAIAVADCDQLAKLLTALVRQDRFSEGTLERSYADKILVAIVERAESLLTTSHVRRRKGASGARP